MRGRWIFTAPVWMQSVPFSLKLSSHRWPGLAREDIQVVTGNREEIIYLRNWAKVVESTQVVRDHYYAWLTLKLWVMIYMILRQVSSSSILLWEEDHELRSDQASDRVRQTNISIMLVKYWTWKSSTNKLRRRPKSLTTQKKSSQQTLHPRLCRKRNKMLSVVFSSGLTLIEMGRSQQRRLISHLCQLISWRF